LGYETMITSSKTNQNKLWNLISINSILKDEIDKEIRKKKRLEKNN
jgi:hypothetical protein